MTGKNHFDVDHLSQLCRIRLSKEEKEIISHQIHQILKYMELLNSAPAEEFAPCTHILETLVNVMRKDTVKASYSREEFLAGAPDQIGGMVKVPPVIHFEES